MACNSCAKPFTLLRKEKGCPGCGFSYCSKCLHNKIFLPKINSEAKVCAKCKRSTSSTDKKEIEAPDAYYKRLAATEDTTKNLGENSKDQQILERLQKLKEDSKIATKGTTEEEITKRLQSIKGDIPTTSDVELQLRLAKLKGTPPATVAQGKPALPVPDVRTEQEQADDLMKQYLEQAKIDTKYKDEFNGLISDIESRMQQLRDSTGTSGIQPITAKIQENAESEDEDEAIKKIIEKVKAESLLEVGEIASPRNDELPFCEICNEDARMRCLGCRYLFCKQCFQEHKDDDDGCDRYEPYKPPQGYQY